MTFNRKLRPLGFLFCVSGILLGLGCTKKETKVGDPKETIRLYIQKSFEVKGPSDKKNLLQYLSGEAKQRLEAWSDEQFVKAFSNDKRKFLRLEFKEVKMENASLAKVTYELSYLDQGRGSESKLTSKKLATVETKDGDWKITSVMGIRELIEFQDELTLP